MTLKILRTWILFLFLLSAGWILFIVLWSGENKYSWIFLLLAAVFSAGLISFRGYLRSLLFRLPYRKCVIAGVILAAVGFVGMLLVSFAVRNDVYDNWDYGFVFSTAHAMAAGKQGIPAADIEYYAMYQNNAFFLRILYRLLQLIILLTGKKDIYFLLNCTIVLNCILITLSILACSYCITGLRSVQQGLLTEIILLLMSPFYLYAAFTYTDVYGLFPAVLTLCFMVKALTRNRGAQKYIWIMLAAISAAAGFQIKGTAVIYLLAAFFCICFAGEFTGRRIVSMAVYVAAAAAAFLIISFTNNAFLEKNGVTAEVREEKGFPAVHFLMMAMNPDNVGQYDPADVDYTSSFAGQDAKKAADLEELQKRMSEMGAAGVLNHIFVKKAKFIYGTGTAAAPNYIVRNPLRQNAAVEFFGRNRVFFEITLLYKTILEVLVLFISVLTLVRREEEDGYMLFMKICWIGMFLFFCIWEAHARYTFIFLPLLGSMAAEYIVKHKSASISSL